MNAPLAKRSFLFLFCLFLTLIIIPLPLRSESPATDPGASLPLSALAIPEEIGKIQERFTGTSARTIIQIQDVHAHAVAQQNIAATLERLRIMFSIQKVALEGAWSSTSLSKSRTVPTSREKQLLARRLLESDLIPGSVYAAIMSPETVTLVGIEEEELYEKNRRLFLAHLEKSSFIKEKLLSYGASLRTAQKTTWNPDLLVFESAFAKYQETSDLGKFLPILLTTSNALGAASDDLTQVLLLRDIMTLEKSFEKERLEAETRQIIQKHKNGPWTLEELVRGGKIPEKELGFYPEIKKLIRLYRLRDRISLQDLTDQIQTLTERILEKLVRSPEEGALWEKTRRFYLSKKILLLQATPEDMKAYDVEKALLETELAEAGLEEPLDLSVDFYETVKKRDEIFFQRITTDPSLAGDVAVITGGFHTDGLSQKFREAGISYITIAPDLGGTAANEKLYNERMVEKLDGRKSPPAGETGIVKGIRTASSPSSILSSPPESETLSELRNQIEVDDAFLRALEILRQTKDVRKAVAGFLGETVFVPTGDKIKDLAARKLLRNNTRPGIMDLPSVQESEFLSLSHAEQLSIFRKWLQIGKESRHRSILVSSVSILKNMLLSAGAEPRVAGIVARGDLLALAQDIPAAETPEALLANGIKRFQVADLDTLLQKTSSFSSLARQHPFVIMKNGYRSENRAVVDEDPVWLELFPVLTLSPQNYRSARNPEFLALMKSLWAEVLSQELPQKAA